jgi:hypothetical protein
MLLPDSYSANGGTQSGLAYAVLFSLLVWGLLVSAIAALL